MLQFRPYLATDSASLWHRLYVALLDSSPSKLRPSSVLESADVRIYAENLDQTTDVDVVAVVKGVGAGASWVCLINGGDELAYVDGQTLQPGTTLGAEYQLLRNCRLMMLAELQDAKDVGYKEVALNAQAQNLAALMYECCGLIRQGVREGFTRMIAKIT